MAGIIKASSRTSASSGPTGVAYQFDDMGDAYISKVKAEAVAIVARAREEAVRVKAEAMEEGRKAALQAADATLRAKVDQQLLTLIPALQQAVKSILQTREAWQGRWEQHAMRVATAIASRIVRREIDRVPEITVDLIREALELASGNKRITLRLNPVDRAALGDRIDQLTATLGDLAPAQIVADPAITPGGCRVDTEFGSIDQQIETQLARIAEELI